MPAQRFDEPLLAELLTCFVEGLGEAVRVQTCPRIPYPDRDRLPECKSLRAVSVRLRRKAQADTRIASMNSNTDSRL